MPQPKSANSGVGSPQNSSNQGKLNNYFFNTPPGYIFDTNYFVINGRTAKLRSKTVKNVHVILAAPSVFIPPGNLCPPDANIVAHTLDGSLSFRLGANALEGPSNFPNASGARVCLSNVELPDFEIWDLSDGC